MTKANEKIESLEVWMRSINEKLDNHIVHISGDISQIKTDIDWVKRFFWLIMGVSVVAIGGAFFSLILK
jgi:hypothetical protein